MFSKFFIDRPIFATVLSVVITLAGLIAGCGLPVTQYPEIAPPTVEVSAVYPGANARVVADTIAAPVEQQVNGVEDMLYMQSQCTNDGRYTLTVTFRPGTDLNLAQVLVQNRVNLAAPILPDLVKRRGVTVKKKSPTVLLMVNLYSPDASRDNLYLSNYATIQLRDELSRLFGVGDITLLGQRDYSMRVWLDPARMASRNISATDIVRAIEQQNVQVAAGQIGQPPAPTDQVFQYTMTTQGRLTSSEEFGNMILKSEQGRPTRLRDVARIELGAASYDQVCTLNRQPSVALSVYQLPGTNALDTANAVRSKMQELSDRFPDGVAYDIVYDTTPFIRESIGEVFSSLRDAVILVALVVLVFLQGWRAAIIPLVAVPVAIVGTFAAMAACSFSLNTLTLFGLVLAIGIVVDDAIVVIEAIEHHLELGKSPRDAAIQAMSEVSGPVVAVGLVLSAVFVPCVFISGVVGQFYRQFALTIAISTLISAFNSLTLSPALAVLLLKPRHQGHGDALPRLGIVLICGWMAERVISYWGLALLEPLLVNASPYAPLMIRTAAAALGAIVGYLGADVINGLLGVFFRWFNIAFNKLTGQYVNSVAWLLRGSALVLVGYGGLLYLTYFAFETAPTGFIPQQDKGYLLVNVRLDDSASLERTARVMEQVEEIAGQLHGVNHTLAIAGQSVLTGASASNFGTMYVMLEDFHHRTGHSADQIGEELKHQLESQIGDATVYVAGAPPIDGLGTSGGFRVVIEDRGDLGSAALEQVTNATLREGAKSDELTELFSSFNGNSAWLNIEIDRDAAKSRGVSLAEVFSTLQVNFGSLYVNDFNRFGRTWQVNVQADSDYRMKVAALKRVMLRNDQGGMVPLGTILSDREVSGPLMLVRYNLYPSSIVSASAAPGVSSGEAITRLGAVADDALLPTMRTEWTELALLQQNAGSTAVFAFVLAVVLVFLVLAAQYESWSLPLAVILVVPMCLLCSIGGVVMARHDINIFTQIGFVVLVGLACKNAILIVEFARARHLAGVNRFDAALEACRLRLRPIIMTSFAFILGVVPLITGTGAGAEMRRTLGTAVFWGMLGVTLFGIFLTPVFFYVIQWFTDWRASRRAALEAEFAAKH